MRLTTSNPSRFAVRRAESMRLILLIDDDPEFSYLIERYCLLIHWSLVQACCTEEALAQIRLAKPTMILLNLLLPPFGGWQILRELKQKEEAQGIPVTAYSSMPDEERAWMEGADFCLWKPVMFEEFIATLEAANLLP